ncbi:MAG: sialate O-acetylesterase [Bacteroidales bacterium]|nr:sialate O-acetylesterase [Bacteroidales bacterium]
MKSLKRILTVLFISFIIFYNVRSEVKLPSIFGENMVLQQKSDISVWGLANPTATVEIKVSWGKAIYTGKADKNGKWKIQISTPDAGGPYEISITDGDGSTVLSNVLIGEVWLCSGQSNMEMPMKGYKGQPILGSNDAILKSSNKNIRFITVPRAADTEPKENFEGYWQSANPQTVSEFSATAYYFARLLNEVLEIPIGLVNVSYGGSCIEAWMSKSTSQQFEETEIPQKGDSIKVRNRTPTALFNGMLSPVIGFTIKGCIWYQGETNYKNPNEYTQLFAKMVDEWRSLWGIGNFPFYYAQIAPFDYKAISKGEVLEKHNSAYLREAQLEASGLIPNSGMAVLMDIGEEKCIHPSRKDITGNRLAYWALKETYGTGGIGCASPVYKGIEIKDTTIVISFDNVPNGITTYGKESVNFEIAGADKVFYPAKAIAGRTTITVYASNVRNPVAVRYAFKDFAIGDLYSTEGLPVSSFRSDNW